MSLISVLFLLQYQCIGVIATEKLADSSHGTRRHHHHHLPTEQELPPFVPKCSHLQQIKDIITKTKARIWKDWDVSNFPNFLAYMQIPESSWNLQKAKFIKLILTQETVDGHKGEVTNPATQLKNQSFVVGMSGSSVTAGHGELIFGLKFLIESDLVVFACTKPLPFVRICPF